MKFLHTFIFDARKPASECFKAVIDGKVVREIPVIQANETARGLNVIISNFKPSETVDCYAYFRLEDSSEVIRMSTYERKGNSFHILFPPMNKGKYKCEIVVGDKENTLSSGVWEGVCNGSIRTEFFKDGQVGESIESIVNTYDSYSKLIKEKIEELEGVADIVEKIKEETVSVLEEEKTRVKNEEQRVENENARLENDKKRENIVLEMNKNYEALVKNENVRKENEENRNRQESSRKENEEERKENENVRIANEKTREEERKKYNGLFETLKGIKEEISKLFEGIKSSESKREENENKRVASFKDMNERLGNITAKEETRVNEEKTRLANENVRIENEEKRNQAEKIRTEAEIKRELEYEKAKSVVDTAIENNSKFSEQLVAVQELEKDITEKEVARKNRYDSFTEKMDKAEVDEDIRAKKEEDRNKKESERLANEVERNNNERDRKINEDGRVKEENKRIEAEKIREKNETKREEKYNQIEKGLNTIEKIKEETGNTVNKVNEAEQKRNESEKARERYMNDFSTKAEEMLSSENERLENEKIRVQAENDRIKEENRRKETDKQIQSTHNEVQSLKIKIEEKIANINELNKKTSSVLSEEQKRVESEEKRNLAETERVLSENTRKEKENERIANENKREGEEVKRANAETEREKNEVIRQNNEEKRIKQSEIIKQWVENPSQFKGKDVYDLWLELGNKGSKEDFINSLKGKDGINGVDGKSADVPSIRDGQWFIGEKPTGVFVTNVDMEQILKNVDEKIKHLVGIAPNTLDTFEELAKAIGNDANFAESIKSLINEKADKNHTHTDIPATSIKEDDTHKFITNEQLKRVKDAITDKSVIKEVELISDEKSNSLRFTRENGEKKEITLPKDINDDVKEQIVAIQTTLLNKFDKSESKELYKKIERTEDGNLKLTKLDGNTETIQLESKTYSYNDLTDKPDLSILASAITDKGIVKKAEITEDGKLKVTKLDGTEEDLTLPTYNDEKIKKEIKELKPIDVIPFYCGKNGDVFKRVYPDSGNLASHNFYFWNENQRYYLFIIDKYLIGKGVRGSDYAIKILEKSYEKLEWETKFVCDYSNNEIMVSVYSFVVDSSVHDLIFDISHRDSPYDKKFMSVFVIPGDDLPVEDKLSLGYTLEDSMERFLKSKKGKSLLYPMLLSSMNTESLSGELDLCAKKEDSLIKNELVERDGKYILPKNALTKGFTVITEKRPRGEFWDDSLKYQFVINESLIHNFIKETDKIETLRKIVNILNGQFIEGQHGRYGITSFDSVGYDSNIDEFNHRILYSYTPSVKLEQIGKEFKEILMRTEEDLEKLFDHPFLSGVTENEGEIFANEFYSFVLSSFLSDNGSDELDLTNCLKNNIINMVLEQREGVQKLEYLFTGVHKSVPGFEDSLDIKTLKEMINQQKDGIQKLEVLPWNVITPNYRLGHQGIKGKATDKIILIASNPLLFECMRNSGETKSEYAIGWRDRYNLKCTLYEQVKYKLLNYDIDEVKSMNTIPEDILVYIEFVPGESVNEKAIPISIIKKDENEEYNFYSSLDDNMLAFSCSKEKSTEDILNDNFLKQAISSKDINKKGEISLKKDLSIAQKTKFIQKEEFLGETETHYIFNGSILTHDSFVFSLDLGEDAMEKNKIAIEIEANKDLFNSKIIDIFVRFNSNYLNEIDPLKRKEKVISGFEKTVGDVCEFIDCNIYKRDGYSLIKFNNMIHNYKGNLLLPLIKVKIPKTEVKIDVFLGDCGEDVLNEYMFGYYMYDSLSPKIDVFSLNKTLEKLKTSMSDVKEKIETLPDISNLVTKDSVENYITKDEVKEGLSNKIDKEELKKYQLKDDAIQKNYFDEKINSLSEKIKNKVESSTLSSYQLKEDMGSYIDTKRMTEILNGYAKSESITNLVDSNTLDQKLRNYVKTESLNTMLEDKVDKSALSNYQTKGDYALKSEIPKDKATTLSDGLMSKEDKTKLDSINLNEYQPKGEYLTPADLKEYQPKGEYLTQSDLKEYQPKGEYLTPVDLRDYQPKGEYVTNNEFATKNREISSGIETIKTEITEVKNSFLGKEETAKSTLTILNQNGQTPIKIWIGSESEKRALQSIDDDTVYIEIEGK